MVRQVSHLHTKRNETELPTIHIISDAVGLTAQAVARAASSQFGITNPRLEVVPKVNSFEDIKSFLEEHSIVHQNLYGDNSLLVFYTLVNNEMKDELRAYVAKHKNIMSVDLMSDAVSALARSSGLEPSTEPGGLHVADQHYFDRITALEFTIDHDDGRNPQDLAKADIVILGVSRSSKTPLSVYLAQEGYKVANVPLDLQTSPPKELANVESTRLFGLVTAPEILVTIRKKRLGLASGVASSYANPEKVSLELKEARALMRKLGCIVIHTDNRAVEDTAQEILRYYELTHPR
jgi:regulator of PEP synthase PpsR (kinase-PPPase family)